MSKRQTIINLGSSILSMVVNLGINFFVSPYIIENLGAEANGFVSLASNFVMYASLATLALNSMAGRFISIAYHKGEIKKANSYYSSVIAGNFIVVICLILPAIYAVAKLETIINITSVDVKSVKILFIFVFLNFFISQLTTHLSIATYVTNKLYLTSIVAILKSILNVILLSSIFYIFTPQIYFTTVVASVLTVFSFVCNFIIKRRILCDVKFSFTSISVYEIKELLLSGIWNSINQCGHILLTGLDLVLANAFIDGQTMGMIALAKVVPAQLVLINTTVTSVFLPNILKKYVENDLDFFLKVVNDSARAAMVITLIPSVTFFVYSIEFYSLWVPTEDANKLALYSIVSIFYIVLFSGTNVLYNILIVKNKLKTSSVSFIVTGVLNLIVVVVMLLFTELGAIAIAGVSATLNVFRQLFYLIPYVAKISKVESCKFYRLVLESVIVSCLIACLAVYCKQIIPPISWMYMFASIFVELLILIICGICLYSYWKYIKKKRRFNG